MGYGLAGSAFHAPLVEAVAGLSLTSIVTSDPERAERARTHHPGARILASADELFEAAGEHDLVVVAAPNREHLPLGLRAVSAGLHLVVDKPLAASVGDAQRLAGAAAERGVVASVFHNRRWDGDFLTLRRLSEAGRLGPVVRLESRFERWRPEPAADRWRESAAPEDAGGVLFDLGPHLIDQALALLGPARSVYAEVRALRAGAEVDDDVFVAIEHGSGAVSHLSATMLAAQAGPRFRALGTQSAYVKWGLDVQEEQLRKGIRPDDPDFGVEPPGDWGLLGAEDPDDPDRAPEPVRTERGRYVDYYEALERAIRAASEPAAPAAAPPVPLSAGVETLRVIDAARDSSSMGIVVAL